MPNAPRFWSPLPENARWSPLARVAAVALTGATVAGVGHLASPAAARPAAVGAALTAAAPSGEVARARPPAQVPGTAAPKAAPARGATPAKAAPAAVPARAASAAVRSVPDGTGMWLHVFDRTEGGNAKAIVRKARQTGLSTLYVRTGSTHDGFTPDGLGDLLAATKGTGIAVVPWDFPELKNPRADALRLAKAAWYRRHFPGQPHVTAVSPDIETPAEGTRTSAAAVTTYMQTLRAHLPKDVAIIGTVPWPSKYRLGSYPYRAVARYSDALAPMAYWYTNNPGYVTTRSVQVLQQFNRPVMPVGQGYDSRIDVPSLPASRPGPELDKFFTAAHHTGVKSVSLWSWQTAGHDQWRALKKYRTYFPKPKGHDK